MIKRAVAYCRFSSENQRDGYSIEAQLFAIKEFCNKENFELVGEYIDEAKSATTDDRKNFQRMIQDSEKHQFDFIIIHKLDRFSRNRYDFAFYKKILKDNGVKVISVLEKLDDTPETIILESVLEGMAEYYSSNLSRETKKGLHARARKGLSCSTRPLGYDISEEGKFIINQDESPIVQEIFSRVIQGDTLTAICTDLKNRGVKGTRSANLEIISLKKIIRNTIYYGTYTYASKSDEPIIVDNVCDPIVSYDVWISANSKLESKKRVFRRHKENDFLLTGVLWCGECGSHYTGHSVTYKDSVYLAYRCTGHTHGICDMKPSTINRDRLEEIIFLSITNDLFSDKMVDEWIIHLNKQKSGGEPTKRESLEKEIRKLKNKKDRLLDIYLDGKLDKDVYYERNISISGDISRLEMELATCEIQDNKPVDKQLLKDAFKYFRETLKTKDRDVLKRMIDLFVEKIIIYKDKIEIIYKIKGSNEEPLKSKYGFLSKANSRCIEFSLHIIYDIQSYHERNLIYEKLNIRDYTIIERCV